jgi:hypothetical protein
MCVQAFVGHAMQHAEALDARSVRAAMPPAQCMAPRTWKQHSAHYIRYTAMQQLATALA